MPRIPLDWLAEHVAVDPELTAQTLAADLVKVGLEEEAIHRPDVTGPIVVGRVLTLDKKEQSNGKLINYCRVDVGAHNDAPGEGKEPSELPSRGIICGAHNFVVGDYVVVSLPGAVLPGGFAIASRKTYGHISDGMICSRRELGLGEDHSGIIVLAHDEDEAQAEGIPAVGEDVLGYLGLTGEVLEINVTPDRGYCFSMRGVAREYAHSTGAQFTDRGLPDSLSMPLPPVTNTGFPIEVCDEQPIHGNIGCDRFVTRIVRGVDPHVASPRWMQERLSAAGMRPISLAVDATNYVMLDLGQPLHAYDLDAVVAPIVVRRAQSGERLVTLDGVDRELHPQDLVIADSFGGHGARAVGLAGTMGGAATEISESTVNILVEAAHFDAVSVARMARRHKLPSEASKRFERGVDPMIAPVAAQRVVDLLVEYGGGVADEANFEFNEVTSAQPVDFAITEVARLTGLELSAQRIDEILSEIGCEVEAVSDTERRVTPPSWRTDLVGGAHLVEEIARLVGYDEIDAVLPPAPAGSGLTQRQRDRRDMGRTLAESGWVEVLSYPFIASAAFDAQQIAEDDPRRRAMRLANPLQEDAPYLRTSILDSLLATARMNVARGNPEVAIFEAGAVTRPGDVVQAEIPSAGARPAAHELANIASALPRQPYHVAGVAVPEVSQPVAGMPRQLWDWRDAIEAVVAIGRTIGVEVSAKQASYSPFHPGRCAQLFVGDSAVGYAGELDPRVCSAWELPSRSIAFECDADALVAARSGEPRRIVPVRTSPAAKEDMAFVVDETLPAARVREAIERAGGDVVEQVRLFDVYTGDQIPAGKKSLAFAVRLRGEQTLTPADTTRIREHIIQGVARECDAQLRG
ncbi:phenylalanine--tRNA ligase subunit beta [Trueperella sp. LYQ143]|uniref:phenylalanine--tRNA ligase subunit beta n=1 Tax=Trueperella sp. LYQ143 TaxID=3391059 RepID=UPI0039832F7E